MTLKPRRSPRFCVWEITLACNASCVHCGSAAGFARDDELDREEALRLCGDLARLGVRRVTLSGGEPLMRPDWQDIARSLVECGVEADMISNGIALDEPCARRIKELGLKGVTLSIDGNAEVHDALRGVEGAFSRAFEAARNLLRQGVPVGAATQVNRRNLALLPELERALAGAGFQGWQIQLTMPMGRCEGDRELVLRPEEVGRVMDFVVEAARRRPFPVYAADNVGWMTRKEPLVRSFAPSSGRFFHGCHAGLALIGITSRGDLRGCLSLPPDFNEGTVRERDLVEMWRDEDLFSYNRRFREDDLTGPCRSCPFRRLCRAGCTCLAYTTQGSVTENPYCARLFEQGPGEGKP